MPVLITAGLSPEAYRLERILKEARSEKREARGGNRESRIEKRETGTEKRETGIEKREASGDGGDAQDVVFADVSPLPQLPGRTSLILPRYDSASFVHEMLKACLDLNISKIYPLKAGEVMELSKARALFLEYNVMLLIPSEEWLNDHIGVRKSNAENVTVLEDGKLLAGTSFPDKSPANNETGIFSWATKDEKTEYSLYLVNDAGI